MASHRGKFKVIPFIISAAMFLNKIFGIEGKPQKYQPTATKNELIGARIFGTRAICGGLFFLFLLVSMLIGVISLFY